MKVFNTLTRNLDTLEPLEPQHVKLYTCGLTVYSQPHIGNWAAYIYWDVLVRTLKLAGYQVTRVQNITDVGHLTSDEDTGEDKMEKGAKREGVTAWDIADKYIKIADHEAYDLLKLTRPDQMPRATKYIPQQIAFVELLEKKGFTYEIPDDGIYFDTSKLPDYGKLARLDIEGLQPGLRVAFEGKRNITDFALWKFSPKGQKRDMEWDSPWGKGFPGWHLECSVMARELLGDQIDMHTGGIDHIPVHHTNEIAQTEAVTGKIFATYWLHNNHLRVDGTKISKSLGNVFTLQDIVDKGYSIEAYKLLVLSSHYRNSGNFTWEIVASAQARLTRFQNFAARRFQHVAMTTTPLDPKTIKTPEDTILPALEDDLNTPEALSKFEAYITAVEEQDLANFEYKLVDYLNFMDNALGLSLMDVKDINDDQKELIRKREAARSEKNWTESDNIRKQLSGQGIGIRDTGTNTIWYRQ